MNLRNKVVGTVSAVLLAATMTAGMASAANDPQVTTSVTLTGNTGVCTVESATAGGTSSASFGVLTWDPASGPSGAYVTTSNAPITLVSTITSTGPKLTRSCGINIAAAGGTSSLYSIFESNPLTLVNADGHSAALPDGDTAQTFATAAAVNNGNTAKTGTLSLDPSSLKDAEANAGNYTATLTFTVVDSAI